MFFSASLLKLPRKSFELQTKGAIRNQCSTCLESTVLTKCKLILPSKSTSFHKSFKNNLTFFKSNKQIMANISISSSFSLICSCPLLSIIVKLLFYTSFHCMQCIFTMLRQIAQDYKNLQGKASEHMYEHKCVISYFFMS